MNITVLLHLPVLFFLSKTGESVGDSVGVKDQTLCLVSVGERLNSVICK